MINARMTKVTTPKMRENSGETFDLVLAYVLGDVTDEQRELFESRLSAGDPELTASYEKAIATLAELPRALTASIPPPFVKEKIMARVQEGSIDYTLSAAEYYHPPMSVVGKVLNAIPGYGSGKAGSFIPRFAFRRRTLSFAFMVFGGLFASAYAFDQITPMLRQSAQAEAVTIQHARELRLAKFDSQIPGFPNAVAGTHINTVTNVGVAQSLNLSSGSSSLASYSSIGALDGQVGPADPSISVPPMSSAAVTRMSTSSKPIVMNAAEGPHSEDLHTNLGNLDLAFQFHNGANATHYSLSPVNGESRGNARLYWNTDRSDAFFSVSDLAPTSDDQHYVLYYTLEDGSLERMRAFTTASGAQRSFLVRRSPWNAVTGARLILESGNNDGNPSKTTVLAATTKLTSK